MQTYKDYRKELKAEQEGMTPEQVIEHMQAQKDINDKPLYSHILDINNLPPQEHHWVDRGTVMSCEGGMHQHHQSFKRK